MKNDADRPSVDPSPSATERLLQRYHDAELRPSERREFEARLQEDSELRAQLASMEQAAAFLAADSESCEPVPLAIGFADRLFSRIDAERVHPVPRVGSASFGPASFKRWIAIAASFLVFLLAAHAFTLPPQGDDLSAEAKHSQASKEKRKLIDLLDRKANEKEARLASPSQLNAEKGTSESRKK